MNEDISLLDYMTESQVWGFGPMWFVEALLIFTFVYLIWKYFEAGTFSFLKNARITTTSILLLAVFIGICQFLIRIKFPVGWAMPFTQFQLPHFVQYIILFGLGTMAHKMKWMETLDLTIGKKWFVIVNLLIFIGFPVLFILGGAHKNGPDAFMGGFNWKCLSYAIWEQIVGLGMIVALFGIFKGKFNSQRSLAKKLSASAYAVYVFHTPIIVGLAIIFLDFNIPQFWKFVVLAPIALLSCFLVAYVVKQIPGLKNIL